MDQPVNDAASIKTATPNAVESSVENTPRTHPNVSATSHILFKQSTDVLLLLMQILPVFVPAQLGAPVVSDKEVSCPWFESASG
jgi:hypothetical protein